MRKAKKAAAAISMIFCICSIITEQLHWTAGSKKVQMPMGTEKLT